MPARATTLLATLALAACGGPARYTGTLTPTSGRCQAATATLVRSGRTLSFAPTDGALTLPGTATQAADGTVRVHAVRVDVGANHKPYPLELVGTLTPTQFDGQYRTPACRAQVSLHRPPLANSL